MACVLCAIEGREGCPGCEAADGRDGSCPIRLCTAEKGVGGCYACSISPCGKECAPLQNKRNKAFLRYAREFGTDALIERLRINFENGIVYQQPGTPHDGESGGDYDALKTEIEIYRLLRYGRGGERNATPEAEEIIIKPLSPELTADYFDFFNNRAFTDNPPWGGCYCTNFQMTKDDVKAQFTDRIEEIGDGPENFMRVLREIVVRQIDSGALRGYLAYAGGFPIGWCNANDKANYPAEFADGSRLFGRADKKEKAVVCFEIAPEYRSMGVATALLERVVKDAIAEDCTAVEGYPRTHDKRDEWDFTGPMRLYEKAGFAAAAGIDGKTVMRKEFGASG